MHAKLAFRTLHTIPQQISAPSITHFTFRIPLLSILQGSPAALAGVCRHQNT